MKDIDVSIIIPVYNVDEYLPECLESIINQTLKNIEIICINDGSTDNSLDILNEYSEKDDRIRVINQENKGLGATRNVGIKNASGEYVYFMDSDDYLELTAIEELYNIAKENRLDILLFKLINFNDDTPKDCYTSDYYEMVSLYHKVKDKVFSYKDVKDIFFNIAVSAPGKLFKYDLIKNLKFPENLIFEDNVFFTEAFLKSKRNKFYNKHLYYRRIRNNSITTSYFKNFSDAIIILNQIMDLFKKNGLFEEYKLTLYNRKINQIFYRYSLIENEEYKSEFFNKMKEDFLFNKQDYEKDNEFSKIRDRLKYIFNATLESSNTIEFDLKMKLYDLNNHNNKLVHENKNINEKLSSITTEYEFLKVKLDKCNEKDKILRNNYFSSKRLNYEVKKNNYDLNNELVFLKEKLVILNEKNHLITKEKERMEINNNFLRKELDKIKEKNYLLNKENEHFKSTKAYKIWINYASLKNNNK